ncbi:hypothetical protein [Paenibacillus sp. 481]|uniref:hypothetical protein n=1 Tax=Paenibacillus sp. 481 TaxID=2835869 RepID=UPI001E40EBE8|nr:hypothetical protein [Paenibacillus sp. 481]UHA72548.1 hypothetical protein KIK04_18065 [Paenibacillus sp. 481]
MKLKKFLAVLMVASSLTVFAPSAFAMPGMGDTKEAAIKIDFDVKIHGYLQDSKDYDWYTWENRTGKNRFLHFSVSTNSEHSGLLLGAVVDYPFGQRSIPFYSDPTNKRSLNLTSILVPPFGKISYFIRNTGDKIEPYHIHNFNFSYERPGDVPASNKQLIKQ